MASVHAAAAAVRALTDAQVIVLATPVFFLLMGIELVVAHRRGLRSYRLSDALNSIGLGMMSQVLGLFANLLLVGLYAALFDRIAPWRLPTSSAWVWGVALVLYDLLYYWHHRLGHTVALLWAAHAVHHQSEDYNLSTALRQTSTEWVAGWVFYLPMALLGFPPLVFAVAALIDLLYQYWVHTELVGRLGWFDRWFCAPSNHRVHHAVNDRYLDKNFGGIFMVWDRLFGTYCAEDAAEPCVYGTRSALRSWNPLWANLQVYAGLWQEMRRCSTWRDRLGIWLRPPGWRPADVLAVHGPCAFDIAAVERYDPPLPRGRGWLAGGLFAALVAASAVLLWNAAQLSGPVLAAGMVAMVAALWLVGRACTPAAG